MTLLASAGVGGCQATIVAGYGHCSRGLSYGAPLAGDDSRVRYRPGLSHVCKKASASSVVTLVAAFAYKLASKMTAMLTPLQG